MSARRSSRAVALVERAANEATRRCPTLVLFSANESGNKKQPATVNVHAADWNDPSKGTPSGWSLFSPQISVRVCRTLPGHSIDAVRETMYNCAEYKQWWPKHWVFDIERCTPDVVDSVIHFKSQAGPYSVRLTGATRLPDGSGTLSQNYYQGILKGDMSWIITPVADPSSCQLCYDAQLMPMTFAAQVAAAVSSQEYLASYFEPLVISLKAELDARQAIKK